MTTENDNERSMPDPEGEINEDTYITQEKDVQTELIGTFGWWQALIFSVAGLTVMIHSCQMMANKFLTYPVGHWCERPNSYRNISVEKWLNISSPLLKDGSFDRCHMFNINSSQPIFKRPPENSSTIACHSWEYDENTFQVYLTIMVEMINILK